MEMSPTFLWKHFSNILEDFYGLSPAIFFNPLKMSKQLL